LNGVPNTATQEDLQRTGTSVSNHEAAVENGASDCLSTARSYAQSTALGISYTTSDSNSSCPPPPLTASISGTSATTITGTASQTLTWNSIVSGGTAPYTYSWTIDGSSGGTGSSASRTYTGNNIAHTQTVNVTLTVRDSSGQSAPASFTTTITYTVSSGGTGGGGGTGGTGGGGSNNS